MKPIIICSENIEELKNKLSKEFSIQLSKESLTTIISTWNNWVNYNDKAKSTNLNDERNRLDRIISGLETGLQSLKKLQKFEMSKFSIGYKLTDQNEAIILMENELQCAKRTKLFLAYKGLQSPDWIQLVAMIGLFNSAETHGLKPLHKVGRGNKNPIKSFIMILTGEDREKIDRYYTKYKQWKNGKLSLIR